MTGIPTFYHATGFLQLIAVSDYKRQQSVGYFSLPAEIRTMIMELLFVFRDISLDRPKPRNTPSGIQIALHRAIRTVTKHNDTHSKPRRALRLPGFQLLATCKQACTEGFAVFYSFNRFFLPSGSVEHARDRLHALQPQHRDMIKTFGLDMGLKDFTPAVFEVAHHAMQQRYGNALTAKPNFRQGEQWGILVAEELKDIWKQKLHLLVTASMGLGHPKPILARKFVAPNAEDTDRYYATFDEKNDKVDWSPGMRKHVWYTAKLIQGDVEQIVSNEGWKALRKWVNKGESEWEHLVI